MTSAEIYASGGNRDEPGRDLFLPSELEVREAFQRAI